MAAALATLGDQVATRLGGRALPWTARGASRVAARLAREAERRRVADLGDREWVEWAYREVFSRDADAVGLDSWTAELTSGRQSRGQVLDALRGSPEAAGGDTPRLAQDAFHGSRMAWMRSLPRARRILDLGGTALGSPLGSLLVMGYPYHFEELIIIDLPPDDRHSLYQVDEHRDLVSDQGPVRYLYRSMIDLDDLPDGGFDLIVSGQTFEHITEKEGGILLSHVGRLLAPGGTLAMDTPNRAVTEIHCAELGTEWINPDHKIEYTHPQLSALFADNGLELLRAQGIGYMPETARSRTWHLEELIEYPGLYDAIEDSYTLAYLAAPRR